MLLGQNILTPLEDEQRKLEGFNLYDWYIWVVGRLSRETERDAIVEALKLLALSPSLVLASLLTSYPINGLSLSSTCTDCLSPIGFLGSFTRFSPNLFFCC